MAAAEQYATERELALYLDSELGAIADALGWSVPDDGMGEYGRAVNATLRAMGLADIAAGDAGELEAVGLRETLKRALTDASTRYTVSLDGQTLNRSDFYKMVKERYADAIADADGYADDAGLRVLTVRHADDPYTYEAAGTDL